MYTISTRFHRKHAAIGAVIAAFSTYLIVWCKLGPLVLVAVPAAIYNIIHVVSYVTCVTLPAHDPENMMKGKGSTHWSQDMYCHKCLKSLDHSPWLEGICSKCGYINRDGFGFRGRFGLRSKRLYWDGARWVAQYKY